jgi:hypothetical protein
LLILSACVIPKLKLPRTACWYSKGGPRVSFTSWPDSVRPLACSAPYNILSQLLFVGLARIVKNTYIYTVYLVI